MNIFSFLSTFFYLVLNRFKKSVPAPIVVAPAPEPVIEHEEEEEGTPPPPPAAPKYLFDTPQNARHSIRVICDEEGLSLRRDFEVEGKFYQPKDIICACIEQESSFMNYLPNGNPVKRENRSTKTGALLSTDWGICQINDYYHIGVGKSFSSVDFVMHNPAEVIRWMARMMKAGKIKLWVSYTSGAFKRYLPQN